MGLKICQNLRTASRNPKLTVLKKVHSLQFKPDESNKTRSSSPTATRY